MLATCRASKEDQRTLPPLRHHLTRLKFAPEHAQSYNDLIEVGRLQAPIARRATTI